MAASVELSKYEIVFILKQIPVALLTTRSSPQRFVIYCRHKQHFYKNETELEYIYIYLKFTVPRLLRAIHRRCCKLFKSSTKIISYNIWHCGLLTSTQNKKAYTCAKRLHKRYAMLTW